MRVLGVITARGGSKGIPRKNVRRLGGRALLGWTADAARASQKLARTILSTDDDEIADVGRAHGVDVPFMRPAELARDSTPTLPVLQHAVATLEASGDRYDAVCLLQPTSPFRTTELIDACVAAFEKEQPDSLVTMLPVPHEYNPHWVYGRSNDGWMVLVTGEKAPIARRQELPPAFHREGSIYITRRDVLMDQASLYGDRVHGFVVDERQSVNLDTEQDWARAEAMLAAR